MIGISVGTEILLPLELAVLNFDQSSIISSLQFLNEPVNLQIRDPQIKDPPQSSVDLNRKHWALRRSRYLYNTKDLRINKKLEYVTIINAIHN